MQDDAATVNPDFAFATAVAVMYELLQHMAVQKHGHECIEQLGSQLKPNFSLKPYASW